MRLIKVLACLAACLLLVSSMALAQGVGASGDIKGTVTDPSGAVLGNATVVATDVGKGIKHTAVSDANGEYQLRGLAPATYDVSTQLSGFQNFVQKGVVVNVGQTATLDFRMKVSQVAESVEVTTEAPVVDTERGHQAEVITSQYISELPINRRDYLTFTLLAPGVSDSTRLAGDQDFRVKQTPQSGLSFYGSNGRGNSVTVDGGEANDDAGGVRLNLGQDAVQEFQINRSNYGADLGGASGASINIVSRTGTNDMHGSLFGFFRNDALDARNPFSFTQALAPGQVFNPLAPDVIGAKTKDSLSRQQFGGSLGFPVSRDKTFAFLSFEGLRQDAQNAVPLLTNTSIFRPQGVSFNNQQAILTGLAGQGGAPVPCISNGTAAPPTVLPASTCAGILTGILTVNPATSPLSNFLVNQFESNGGLFAYGTRQVLASGRLDHTFNDNNQGYIRYSFGRDNEANPDVQALTGVSRGSSVHALDNTLQASWFHTFSPTAQNEVRAQGNYSVFNVLSNSPAQVGLDIPGFANLGSNIFLPSLSINRRFEFSDNFSKVHGSHALKFGAYELVRGNTTQSHTFFPGRFVFGALPGGIISPCLQVPAACGLTGVQPAVIDALQSASLGLPQFYQQGFGSPRYAYTRPWTAFYAQDQWAVKPNFTLTYGLRYELDQQYGNLNTDKNNLAPRVSFAWDPWSDHKTVVRGGFGIFYSPIYGQIGNVVQTLGIVNGFRQIAQTFVPLTGVPGAPPSLTSAAIFQTLFAQGKISCTAAAPGAAACITPADLTQFGINVTHTGPVPPLSVIFSGQPGYRNPYSEQGEFGIERQVGKSWSVAASYVYVHTIGLPVALDTNLLASAPITTGPSAVNPAVQVPFRNWGAPQCAALPSPCFANPLILQNNVYSSAASALYQGGILEIQKRLSNHFTLLANYTYSKAISTATDFNSDFAPVDETNLAGERGLSDFDQRHKVVVASVIDTGGSYNNAMQRIFGGFQIAPIIRYNSGQPFNILAGSDINGDRHSTNDRPLGVGKNAGQGPDFADVDLRLGRAFKIHERASLNFTAEAFNLFNRTNFASVNNVDPGLVTQFSGTETDPLHNPVGTTPFAFTSANIRRQLQFGARLSF
jgi:hypothetical protein